MKFRVLISVIVAVTAMVATSTANAHSSRQEQINFQLKRYYHADGYIKAIGAVAYRTEYNSNYRIRTKWKRALRWLISVRAEAQVKIRQLRAPPAPKLPSGLPPHYSALMCIHGYEGSWNDGGAPYYGGLQMDWDFMSTYGAALLRAKGTADHWTPLEQMWVAEKAISSRGFSPWPSTARLCGVL